MGKITRLKAMERFLKFPKTFDNKYMNYPCQITIEGIKYYGFTDGYSIAITTEDIGTLELYDADKYNGVPYPNLAVYLEDSKYTKVENFQINSIITEAKKQGFKLTKHCNRKKPFLLKFAGAFYDIALIYKAYSIIDTGKSVIAKYDTERAFSPIILSNAIGKCFMLPIGVKEENEINYGHTIIYYDDILNAKKKTVTTL